MKILTKKKQEEMMQALAEIYLLSNDCICMLAKLPGGEDFMKIAELLIGDAMKIADGLRGKRGKALLVETRRKCMNMRKRSGLPMFPFPFCIRFPEEGTEEEWNRHMKEYNEYRLKRRKSHEEDKFQ